MAARRASAEDRAYFARIARQNASLEDGSVPASLAEMFDRLDAMRRTLGELARPGLSGDDEGDLPSHLAFLERIRSTRRGGADGP